MIGLLELEDFRQRKRVWKIEGTEIMINHRQWKNVGYFNYLGSMITNDAKCTCKIKSITDMTKATFDKKNLFTG
jgi:hypothetical protein